MILNCRNSVEFWNGLERFLYLQKVVYDYGDRERERDFDEVRESVEGHLSVGVSCFIL